MSRLVPTTRRSMGYFSGFSFNASASEPRTRGLTRSRFPAVFAYSAAEISYFTTNVSSRLCTFSTLSVQSALHIFAPFFFSILSAHGWNIGQLPMPMARSHFLRLSRIMVMPQCTLLPSHWQVNFKDRMMHRNWCLEVPGVFRHVIPQLDLVLTRNHSAWIGLRAESRFWRGHRCRECHPHRRLLRESGHL